MPQMQREPRKFEGLTYDLVVVGAGIYGACIARDAAIRGLRVALLERGDFGNATSHNSLKLIHGGLRYLQHFDVRRVRQYIHERRHWLKIAPHLVRPLKFVIPTYGHGTRGREALWCALKLYDVMGVDRNRGLTGEQHIPPGGVLSRGECLEMLPGLSPEGLTGGAFWYDAQMLDANRVLLECVQDAHSAGADVINYMEVNALLGDEKNVWGVRATDCLSKDTLEILGRLVVNASGPWVNSLLSKGKPQLSNVGAGLTKGMNLVTRQIFNGYAAGIVSKRRSDAAIGQAERLFFVTPWRNCTVIGTSHLPFKGHPDLCRFTEADIEQFLCEINEAYPALELTLDDVLYCYGGLTPAEDDRKDGEVKRSRRDAIIDHRHVDGVDGLISVLGIKYTSARLVAEWIVNVSFRKLGKEPPPCSTATRLLPGGIDFPLDSSLAKETCELLGRSLYQDEENLVANLGANLRNVMRESHDCKGGRDDSFFRLLSRYSVKHEMAVRVEDVILRRTNLAERGKLTEESITWCADMMQQELGWSAQQRADELAAVRGRGVLRCGGHLSSDSQAKHLPSAGHNVEKLPERTGFGFCARGLKKI